ncbi:MAG: hypothetical protein ABR968_12855 [Bacteroidales bacterium]|jgi:hypothetical protein
MIKNDNHTKFLKLRKQFKKFTFDCYEIKKDSDNLQISYNFNLDNKYFFRPTIQILLKSIVKSKNITDNNLKNIVFHIGMVELLSYWKAACPKQIVIKPFKLNEEQKLWWKNLYFNGLGEFFYLNSIQTNIDDFVEIISETDDIPEKTDIKLDDSVIIPVGGGKDSTVTIELLSEFKDNILLILNPRKACTETAFTAGYQNERVLEIQRSIDPVLLKMNDAGFLNGHTPFSALLAFISLLSSILTGKKHIALSNESSANESTVQSLPVNHQYSKSFEFEKDFREYYKKNIIEEVNYFSFLRPLSELQIASLFSKYPKYFPVFRSCNVGSKNDCWCGKCSKCLFTYIILSPFIEREKMINIFGKDIFDDKNLLHEFNQLIGIAETKPFECVGTISEVNIALCQSINNIKGELPFLLGYYKNLDSYNSYSGSIINDFLEEFNTENYLTERFVKVLKNKLYA